MFDNTPQSPAPLGAPQSATPPQQRPAGREPEDIFAGTDSTPAPRSAAPSVATTPGSQPKPPQFQPKTVTSEDVAAMASVPAAGGGGQNRRYVIIGAIAIGALLLVLAAMVALAYFKAQETTPLTTTTPLINTPQVGDQGSALDTSEDAMQEDVMIGEELLGTSTTESKEEDAQFILDEITDSDNDGLTDGEEKRLGTNIDSADSDNDGLFDRQEVRIYRTDPLNADTDGDGYSDGDEVDNGYNPKGDGKLYELP